MNYYLHFVKFFHKYMSSKKEILFKLYYYVNILRLFNNEKIKTNFKGSQNIPGKIGLYLSVGYLSS